jgi:hypothetical protein
MKRNAHIISLAAVALAALGGCSSQPTASETKKAAVPLEKLQGKVQLQVLASGSSDADLNSGGSSVFLWVGKQRYRLFFRKRVEVKHGDELVVEGINAQKAIDEMGDPAQGKSGYPLLSSCEKVVKMAWTGLPFDEVDVKAAVLRSRMARYPARPIFLVTKMRPVTEADPKTVAPPEEKDIPTVTVAGDKQRALLIEGPTALPAPLWEPKGGPMSCKVIIDADGTIAELQTGAQLCESVPWEKFKYKPTMQGGKPIGVKTEVVIQFEPRK